MYKEKDKSKAICADCRKIVDTTFLYRDLPFKYSHIVVKDILVGTCDRCERVISIPPQSTKEIARQKNLQK